MTSSAAVLSTSAFFILVSNHSNQPCHCTINHIGHIKPHSALQHCSDCLQQSCAPRWWRCRHCTRPSCNSAGCPPFRPFWMVWLLTANSIHPPPQGPIADVNIPGVKVQVYQSVSQSTSVTTQLHLIIACVFGFGVQTPSSPSPRLATRWCWCCPAVFVLRHHGSRAVVIICSAYYPHASTCAIIINHVTGMKASKQTGPFSPPLSLLSLPALHCQRWVWLNHLSLLHRARTTPEILVLPRANDNHVSHN